MKTEEQEPLQDANKNAPSKFRTDKKSGSCLICLFATFVVIGLISTILYYQADLTKFFNWEIFNKSTCQLQTKEFFSILPTECHSNPDDFWSDGQNDGKTTGICQKDAMVPDADV